MVWRFALLLAILILGDAKEIADDARSTSPKGKALGLHTMFAGRYVQRYVPQIYLPTEDSIEYTCEVAYRLIGPDLKYNDKELAAHLEKVFTKFNAVAPFFIKLVLKDGPLIPGASETPCSPGMDTDTCFLNSFKNAENYRSLDIQVITGVSRKTNFPDIGEKEWTYNRMIEAGLRDKGYITRVITQRLDIYPDKVHIMKHIPLTPLYAEETIFQLQGMELLPFNLAKQNLLLASLDCIGLNNARGVGWLDITSVTQAWHWNTSRIQDMGTANVTMITMRDRTEGSMGATLQLALPRLLDRLDEVGLPRLSGKVLTSRILLDYTPQDQIMKMKGKEDETNTFDLRDPEAIILPYPIPTPQSNISKTIGVCTALVLLGGVLFWRASANRAPRRTMPISPFQQDQVFFGQTLEGLRGRAIVPPGGLEKRLSASGGYEPSTTKSTLGSNMNPFHRERHLRRPSSNNSNSRPELEDVRNVGDSATEQAGVEGLSEGRRRAHIKSELEKVASLKGWEIPVESIEICKYEDGTDCLLGEGGFGQVFKGLRGGVQDVAVKVMTYSEELEAQKFWVEINLLKSLSFDRNIVQFYGCVLDEAHPMLILELMEGGNLWSALNGPNSEDFFWYAQGQVMAMDIVRGLFYLHDNRVIHGDLKTKNVLLTKNAATAKLSDVGMSRVLATTLNNSSGFSNAPPGTFAYAAPELILGQRCTFKADIFSLGITLWEICTHENPRRGHLRELRVPEDCPEAIRDLIDQCQEADPGDRPSIKEVFNILKAHQTVPSRVTSNELRKSSASSLSQELKSFKRPSL